LAQAPVKDAKALRAFYAEHCVKCHGEDGSATGPDGKRLKGQDFTNLKEMAHKRDAKLANVIQKGVFFGKAMPAFKDRLTEAESLAMVTEVVRKAEKGKAIKP
jgi:mono/diheme cytochrome c family protein